MRRRCGEAAVPLWQRLPPKAAAAAPEGWSAPDSPAHKRPAGRRISASAPRSPAKSMPPASRRRPRRRKCTPPQGSASPSHAGRQAQRSLPSPPEGPPMFPRRAAVSLPRRSPKTPKRIRRSQGCSSLPRSPPKQIPAGNRPFPPAPLPQNRNLHTPRSTGPAAP